MVEGKISDSVIHLKKTNSHIIVYIVYHYSEYHGGGVNIPAINQCNHSN